MAVSAAGNVGIGVANPTSKLEIAAQDGLKIEGFEPFMTLRDGNSGFQAKIQAAHGDVAFFTDDGSVPSVIMKKIAPGTSALLINAQDGLQIAGFQPFMTLTDTNNNSTRLARIQNANGDLFFSTNSGVATGTAAIVVHDGSGDVEVNGNLTVAEGKDITLAGADCAEDFGIGANTVVEPGTVMVVGEEGILSPSSTSYDKRVAGVISGAGTFRPGLVFDRQQTDAVRQPLALIGKVYCKVDANYGPIEVGDLLSTSDTPGHAMKVGDPAKAFGTVIGKALRSHGEGTGLIPILVALQ